MDMQEMQYFLKPEKLKAVNGEVSFTTGNTDHKWEYVSFTQLAKNVFIASPVPFDDPGYPDKGVLMFAFSKTLGALVPVQFGMGDDQVGFLLSVNGDIAPLPGVGPQFVLESVEAGKKYTGQFECKRLLVENGRFQVTL